MKTRLKDLRQTHGKIEKPELSKLDKIFSSSSIGNVNFSSGQLEELPRNELFLLAIKLGIPPIDNKSLLITRMLKEMEKLRA